MIGYFPPPRSDELLYNIIARLFEAADFRNQRGLGEDLFASSSATSVADLPHRLASLVARLHESTGISTEDLIEYHTLWPYWAAFHSSERRSRTKNEMATGGHPYLSLGLMPSRSPWQQFFRYCHSCVEEDRRSLEGETYWHRIHQIPGITVCGRHGEQLENSNVEFRNPRSRFEYRSAESPNALPANTGTKNSGRVVLISDFEVRMANSAGWLLANPRATKSACSLRERYLWELAVGGFANWNGQLRTSCLLRSFLDRYPAEWLAAVGCGFPAATHESWLERIIHRPVYSQVTFKHLLLIDFLDVTVEGIVCSANPLPFGSAPWPCLNQCVSHFAQLTIQTCEISTTRNGRSLNGKFSCPDCGMCYLRLGPDSNPADRQRRDRVPVYGTAWDQLLIGMWHDSAISLRLLSRRLGVDTQTAKLQAVRLGLRSDRGLCCATNQLSVRTAAITGPIGSVETYKAEWMAVQRTMPAATRTELRQATPKSHGFLRRHAPAWLEEHSPPPLKTSNVRGRVNWPERDVTIATEIAKASARLLLERPPVRLTRTAILCEAHLGWVLAKLDRLPRTAAALEKTEEGRVPYALRRVQIIASEWKRTGDIVPRWRLLRLANLRPDLLACKAVSEAVSRALQLINTGTEDTQASGT